jgi:hypothetical protein
MGYYPRILLAILAQNLRDLDQYMSRIILPSKAHYRSNHGANTPQSNNEEDQCGNPRTPT